MDKTHIKLINSSEFAFEISLKLRANTISINNIINPVTVNAMNDGANATFFSNDDTFCGIVIYKIKKIKKIKNII
jgi:hypothetical protein